jgi:hypothetical protein
MPVTCPIGRQTRVIQGHPRPEENSHYLDNRRSKAWIPEPSKLVMRVRFPSSALVVPWLVRVDVRAFEIASVATLNLVSRGRDLRTPGTMDCVFCRLIRDDTATWIARGPSTCAFAPLTPIAPAIPWSFRPRTSPISSTQPHSSLPNRWRSSGAWPTRCAQPSGPRESTSSTPAGQVPSSQCSTCTSTSSHGGAAITSPPGP